MALQPHHLPIHRPVRVEGEPGIGTRRALVGFAKRAGIPHARGSDAFVAGDVGVPVQEETGCWKTRRGNVDEVKTVTVALDIQCLRQIECEVVVPQDGDQRRAERFAGLESCQVAEIPDVPDFIGPGHEGMEICREAAVGIGNDGDAEGGF